MWGENVEKHVEMMYNYKILQTLDTRPRPPSKYVQAHKLARGRTLAQRLLRRLLARGDIFRLRVE